MDSDIDGLIEAETLGDRESDIDGLIDGERLALGESEGLID